MYLGNLCELVQYVWFWYSYSILVCNEVGTGLPRLAISRLHLQYPVCFQLLFILQSTPFKLRCDGLPVCRFLQSVHQIKEINKCERERRTCEN